LHETGKKVKKAVQKEHAEDQDVRKAKKLLSSKKDSLKHRNNALKKIIDYFKSSNKIIH
jgi:uncharacterized membrane protein YvbJ